MAYSYQTAVSDGTLTNLLIGFNYLDKSEIGVEVGGVPNGIAWSWGAGSQIIFASAVPAGVLVKVKRTTSVATVRHQYTLGAAFTAGTLDENLNQVLHIVQEAKEGAWGDSTSDLRAELALPSGASLIGMSDGTNTTVAAAIADRLKLSDLAPTSIADAIGFNIGLPGGVDRTLASKSRDFVSVLDFGAIGNGIADDTAAFIAAAATGKPLQVPYGDFVLSAPVTVPGALIGAGADDGQTTFTLVGTGQLIVGDWHANWSGFLIRSGVSSKVFIRCPGMSFFNCSRFRAESTGGATGQVGIEFDTTTASIYFADVDNFKFKLAYPVNVVGNSTQVFNANKIGGLATGYYQNFASAISIAGVLATDANEFSGYLEVGTNAVNHTAGALRQNRFRFVLDSVTRAYNTAIAVTTPNIWEILDGGFVTTGPYPQNQILIGPGTTKVRATRATAQSIPSAAATTVLYDSEQYDSLAEFVHTSGVFTAKNTGYYSISGMVTSAAVAWGSTTRWELRVFKNGSEYARGTWDAADAAVTVQRSSQVNTTVQLNAGETLELRVLHNQGAAVNLDANSGANYIDIHRLPN